MYTCVSEYIFVSEFFKYLKKIIFTARVVSNAVEFQEK